MAKELLQGVWNPRLARECVRNTTVSRAVAIDCVANTLAGLGFLNREKADELSHLLNSRRIGVGEHLVSGYLSDLLKLEVDSIKFTKDDVKVYLVANLKPGYSTILNFIRQDGTGHSVVVRKDMWNNLLINDIQQARILPFDVHFSTIEPIAIDFFIYISKPLRKNAMDIEPDLIAIIKQTANQRDRIATAHRIFALPPSSSRSASLLRPSSSDPKTKYSVFNPSSFSRKMKKGGKTKKGSKRRGSKKTKKSRK